MCKYVGVLLRKDMFFNSMCGYYWALVEIMELQKLYGKTLWEDHFIPLVTLQNAFANVGNLAARALAQPPDVPLRASRQMEFPIEPTFGEVKKDMRGMSKYKDIFLGAHSLCLYCPPHVYISVKFPRCITTFSKIVQASSNIFKAHFLATCNSFK